MGEKIIPRTTHWAAGLLVIAALTGCVERQMIITTDPPGAIAFDEQGVGISSTPADRSFVYYGKYRFKIVRDGYETLIVEEDVRPPWYEWLGLDFISENVVPWTIRDIRRFHYQLQPLQVVPELTVLQQGTALRERGKTIGTPAIPPPTPPVVSPPITPPIGP
jgi:hypothetical protein